MPVVGLMLPAGHETLVDSAECDTQDWEAASCRALLLFVEHVPERVRIRLQQLSSRYWLDQDDGSQQSYWMNHCAGCGSRQDDVELYCEFGGAFTPICAQTTGGEGISLQLIPESCEVQASGYAYLCP
jgi:hypothetical protein